MKMVCLDRNTIILLGLIFRQFGLSIGRSGSQTIRIAQYFKQNHEHTELLKILLNQAISRNNLEIKLGSIVDLNDATGILQNLFISKSCFYRSDFKKIVQVYFFGLEIIDSGNIEQNETWMILGKRMMGISNYLIDCKLYKKEREIIKRIEHFDQNPIFHATSYSIQEALALLNKIQ